MDVVMWCLLLMAALIGYAVLSIAGGIGRRRDLRRRRAAYESALAELADDPGNRGLRITALELGRLYYGGLRREGQPTIYDEQAISNDLSASSRG